MASMVSMENMAAIRNIRPMNKVDFHTHILPAFDDGSQSEIQSYRMLKMEADNDAGIVLATPHFYPDDLTPSEFVAGRAAAFKRLNDYMAQKGADGLPEIRLGAEVLLGFETSALEDLRKLAIEGTDYILIEMPYDNWDEWVYEAIERIQVKHGLIPVIAHVERYIPMQKDTQQIFRLMNMEGVLGQMNTRSLLDRRSVGLCHKLIENNMVHVLGSDAHRGQHLAEVNKAYGCIEKKHGRRKVDIFIENSHFILLNKQILKREPRPFKRLLGSIYR